MVALVGFRWLNAPGRLGTHKGRPYITSIGSMRSEPVEVRPLVGAVREPPLRTIPSFPRKRESSGEVLSGGVCALPLGVTSSAAAPAA